MDLHICRAVALWLSLMHSLRIAFKFPEAVARRCSVEKAFLEISQNSQENTCAGACFSIKLQALTLLKKRLWHRCFPVNFAKFLKAHFFPEHLWWLLLNFASNIK